MFQRTAGINTRLKSFLLHLRCDFIHCQRGSEDSHRYRRTSRGSTKRFLCISLLHKHWLLSEGFLRFISLEQEEFLKEKVIRGSDIKSVEVFGVLHFHAVNYLPVSTALFPLLLPPPPQCSVFPEDFQAGTYIIPPEFMIHHWIVIQVVKFAHGEQR